MLISEEYRKEQERLHAKGNYGVASIGFAPLVAEIVNRLKIGHVLDYGCGSMTNLIKTIKEKNLIQKEITYQAYDPGVEKFAGDPVPAELVCCIDVLEHIEPECLDDVLDHLEELTDTLAFLTIHTGPASKTLSDGRNAHLIQQPLEWWLPKIWERFEIHSVQMVTQNGFYVIGYAREKLLDVLPRKVKKHDSDIRGLRPT